MDHDRMREQAEPYALGILTADDRQAFERHLPLCEECQQAVGDARLVGLALGQSVDMVDPPPQLRSRVLAAASATPQVGALRDAPVARATASRLPWWLTAAASVAAIVFGLQWLNAERKLGLAESALRSVRQELAMATSQMASARAVADRAQEQLDIVAARDVVLVNLAGQGPAPSATGRVYWSRSRGLAFAATNLPPLAEGRVYQLWLVTDGAPVSAALITPDSEGAARALVPGVGAIEPKAFALTVEPAGGVPAPTGAMFLLGSL
ncbi:MAG: anti-sigma factor [Vicinamibacterales bacterium]